MLKNTFSSCLESSEHQMDILSAKWLRKKHLNVFITDWFIEKTAAFWDSVKKFTRSHQGCSMKKLFFKILQYSQKNTYVLVFFYKVEAVTTPNFIRKTLQPMCFSMTFYNILKNTFFIEHLPTTTPGKWIWKHFLVVTNLFFARRVTKQLIWRLT